MLAWILSLINTLDMCEQPNDQDYADGLKKRQMVMEFDMTTWRVSYL